jgi:hypothetical protein
VLSDGARPVVVATWPVVGEDIGEIAERFSAHVSAAEPQLLDGVLDRGTQAGGTQPVAGDPGREAAVAAHGAAFPRVTVAPDDRLVVLTPAVASRAPVRPPRPRHPVTARPARAGGAGDAPAGTCGRGPRDLRPCGGGDLRTDARRVSTPIPPTAPVRSRAPFRRRWVLVVTAGEAVGFLVPVLAVLAGAADLPGAAGPAVLLGAGAAEGALLGAAQAGVLAREIPGLSRRDWVLRTAAAAVLAWAIGTGPSTWAAAVLDRPPAVQGLLAVLAAAALLGSIGLAQWTVLRRHVPRAGRWVAWTAGAWLAGLAVFTGITTPLWQPGQPPALVAAIGVLGGVAMALTMATVTGRGAAVLLAGRAAEDGPVTEDGAVPRTWPAPARGDR